MRIAGRAFSLPDAVMGALALAWAVSMAAVAANTRPIASDDALISFEYARNLARGQGLVFNSGERVWGFTSPLHTLLLGGLASAGMDAVRAAFATAFVWIGASSVMLYRAGRDILPRPMALCLGALFLLDGTAHGDYGLESSLLVALQLAFLLAAQAGWGRTASLLAAISCLARPDSLLLVAPVLLFGRETRKPRNLVWFAAVGLAWEGFALAYYGDLVPNSYHAKAGLTEFRAYLANAAAHVTRLGLADPAYTGFVAAERALVVALAGLAVLNPHVRQRPALAYALVPYPWLLVLAYSAIGSYRGHNWESHSARFFFLSAVAVGFLTVASQLAGRWRKPAHAALVAPAALLALIALHGLFHTRELACSLTAGDRTYWGGARYDAYRQIAAWASDHLPPGSSVAISDVGTFGYFTDLRIIDVSGIVTRGISRRERMDHLRVMARLKPDYAVLYGQWQDTVAGPGLRYRPTAYFPKTNFQDFTVMRRDSAEGP